MEILFEMLIRPGISSGETSRQIHPQMKVEIGHWFQILYQVVTRTIVATRANDTGRFKRLCF